MIVDREFFLSFTAADREWAKWLLAELDAGRYTSISQLRDFVGGSNIAAEMQKAAQRARRTLGVLSPQSLRAPYVQQEWFQRLYADPNGEQRALVLVRVEPCKPEGMLAPVVYIDLVGLDEAKARARLAEELAAVISGRRLQPDAPTLPPSETVGASLLGQRQRFPTVLPPVWNVPFRRNPTFTGREEDLLRLTDQLADGTNAAATQALHGSGGIGKTTLAVEYAYRYRSEFDTVWWVRAQEPTTMIADLAGLARTLGLPEANQADLRVVTTTVRRWLEDHDRWLLVLDNAEGPNTQTGLDKPLERVVDLLPQVVHGQVLITSRDAGWQDHVALAQLGLFTSKEAVSFLLARSGSSDQPTATQIAHLLGLLPLALEQAGAYVRETRLSLDTYLNRLRQYPSVALTKGNPRDRDPANTIATTWQVSLERVRPTPGAVKLLEICAFLSSEISRDLLVESHKLVSDELGALANDPFALDEAVAALHRYALVKADEHVVTMHRLLQQVVRDRLDIHQGDRAQLALRLVDAASPGDYTDSCQWPTYDRLLAHALAVTEHAEQLGLESKQVVDILSDTGLYLWQRADYQHARRLLERALRIQETQLGVDHPDTARSLINVANVLYDQRDRDQAQHLLERAVSIYLAHRGPDDPYTAGSLSALAAVLRTQRDYIGARRLLERAIPVQEIHLGADHPDTARSLNNLALVLRGQRDYDGARRLHERALAIREASLGSDHPDTASSYSNLALVLTDQGDLEGARSLHERALHIRESRLGSDHPLTGRSLHNLANIHRANGDLATAQRMHERALAVRERSLKPNHPHTARSLVSLAAVRREQGDVDSARHLYERALSIYEASIGANDPETVKTRRELAAMLDTLDDD